MKVRRAIFSALMLIGFGSPVAAAQVGREQDIVDLRLGQRVLVDDGSCPAGQIKEVTGVTLTTTGIARARKCVPRIGVKSK
jgi:hypothetical protein